MCVMKSASPDAPVAALPPDEKQIIEILKAIRFDPWLVILDDATASLDSRQVQRLFELGCSRRERLHLDSGALERCFELGRCNPSGRCFRDPGLGP